MPYIAYPLTEKTKRILLNRFVPKYKNIICDHITYEYFKKAPEEIILPNESNNIQVIGYIDNRKLEAFVVSIDGVIQRNDGFNYHITFSLGDGSKPVDAKEATKQFMDLKPFNIETETPKYYKG